MLTRWCPHREEKQQCLTAWSGMSSGISTRMHTAAPTSKFSCSCVFFPPLCNSSKAGRRTTLFWVRGKNEPCTFPQKKEKCSFCQPCLQITRAATTDQNGNGERLLFHLHQSVRLQEWMSTKGFPKPSTARLTLKSCGTKCFTHPSALQLCWVIPATHHLMHFADEINYVILLLLSFGEAKVRDGKAFVSLLLIAAGFRTGGTPPASPGLGSSADPWQTHSRLSASVLLLIHLQPMARPAIPRELGVQSHVRAMQVGALKKKKASLGESSISQGWAGALHRREHLLENLSQVPFKFIKSIIPDASVPALCVVSQNNPSTLHYLYLGTGCHRLKNKYISRLASQPVNPSPGSVRSLSGWPLALPSCSLSPVPSKVAMPEPPCIPILHPSPPATPSHRWCSPHPMGNRFKDLPSHKN